MFRIRYRKTIATSVALAVVALFLTLVLTHAGRAKPRPTPRPQAAAPNEVTREAIKPGNYATAIDIHNPSPVLTVTLYAKAVEDGGTPSAFSSVTLAPDNAREIDCTDILSTLLGLSAPNYTTTAFTKGFVVLFARGSTSLAAAPVLLPLDVVGVYTAEPPSVQIPPAAGTGTGPIQTQIPGITLQMLTIAPQQEVVPAAPAGTQGALPAGRYNEYAAKFLCGYLPTPAPPT
jgi:hypothetical protein